MLTATGRSDAPGVVRHITAADLPPPSATPSSSRGPRVVSRPSGAMPSVPAGFKVGLWATAGYAAVDAHGAKRRCVPGGERGPAASVSGIRSPGVTTRPHRPPSSRTWISRSHCVLATIQAALRLHRGNLAYHSAGL